jgi:hypothetical protein
VEGVFEENVGKARIKQYFEKVNVKLEKIL